MDSNLTNWVASVSLPTGNEDQEEIALADVTPIVLANPGPSPLPSLAEALARLQVTTESEMEGKIYVHAIRHAEAHHNVLSLPSDARRAIRDPELTLRGIQQAEFLGDNFPFHSEITLILSSPLLRTLQTTSIVFRSTVRAKGTKIISVPDLREWGSVPCSTGSKISQIFQKLPELESILESRLAPDSWRHNLESSQTDPEYKAKRVAKVAKMFWTLGRLALSGGGEWEGIEIPGVEEGGDCHIVAVSHAGFLRALLGDVEQMYNCELRILVVTKEGDEIRLSKFEV